MEIDKLQGLINSGTSANIHLAFELAKNNTIPWDKLIEPWSFLLQMAEIGSDDPVESLIQLFSVEELVFDAHLFRVKQLTPHIPEVTWQLKQLTRLSLDGMQLQEIPEAIENLTQLRSLSVMQNDLRALPKSMIKLTKLNALWAGNNNFTSFPQEILALDNLELLELNSNHINSIPKDIKQLKKLRTLFLLNNNLSSSQHEELYALLPDCRISFEGPVFG